MILDGLTLIILGILAAPSLILSKKPDAAEKLAKIAKWQGWIGFIAFLWGLWGIIWAILTIEWIAYGWPVRWFTWFFCNIIELVLGFMLGYGLIAKYALSKSEAAKAKADQILAKLAPVQGTLAIISIIFGIWTIIAAFLPF
jgi:hypothetical protein